MSVCKCGHDTRWHYKGTAACDAPVGGKRLCRCKRFVMAQQRDTSAFSARLLRIADMADRLAREAREAREAEGVSPM